MTLTEATQTRLLLFCAVTLVAALFTGAAVLRAQQRELTWLRDDLEEARHCIGQLAPLVDDVRGWAWDAHAVLFPEPAQRPQEPSGGPGIPATGVQAAHGATEGEGGAPETDPIGMPRQPGPDTAPAHAVAGDTLNRILAEHRTRMNAITGGK